MKSVFFCRRCSGTYSFFSVKGWASPRLPSARAVHFCKMYIMYYVVWVWCGCVWVRLQVLVYDILPSTTALFSYVIGSWKLSANEQFFVGAQTVVTNNSNKTRRVVYSRQQSLHQRKLFELRRTSSFDLGWRHLMLMWVLGHLAASTVILVPKPFGGHWLRQWTAVRR